MADLLALIKLLLFLLLTVTICVIYLIIYGVINLLRLPYEPWRNLFMKCWSKMTATIFRLHITNRGEPPKAPFFLVCNHLSYLDIIPIYFTVNCTFVAKKEVRKWPFLGFMISMVGVIFVNRRSKKDVIRVNRLIVQSISKYQGVVVFPEGTSSGGADVLPYRSSLLEVAAQNRIPVYAASIQYATSENDPPAADSVCFYGARHSFPEHLFLMAKNRRIDCSITFDPVPVIDSDRKNLATHLHQKTKKIFIPTFSS